MRLRNHVITGEEDLLVVLETEYTIAGKIDEMIEFVINRIES